MNREQAKAFLPIVAAFANGEMIEFRRDSRSDWVVLDTLTCTYPVVCYRVKPLQYWRSAVISDAVRALNGSLVRCRAWDEGSKIAQACKSEIFELYGYAKDTPYPWIVKTASGVEFFDRCEVLEIDQ